MQYLAPILGTILWVFILLYGTRWLFRFITAPRRPRNTDLFDANGEIRHVRRR